MSEYIKTELLTQYYEKIDSIFNKIKSYRKHLDIVFIFGSASDTSYRNKFIEYTKSSESQVFKYITIENIYDNILDFYPQYRGVGAKKIELANLEHEAINNAYSILLFPESFGSCAELGYFSFAEKSRKKMIILNKHKYNNEDTYVNELINFVHDKKQVSPYYFVDGQEINTFSLCIKKLMYGFKDIESYIKSVYVPLSEIDNEMYKLSFLYEIIKFFPYISQSELIGLLRYIYKKNKINTDNLEKYVISMISLLHVAELINRENISGKFFFKVSNESYNLFNYSELTEEEYKEKLTISMSLKKARGLI
jgi:hypothetical protein